MSGETTQTVAFGAGPERGTVLQPLPRGASVGRYVILETVGSGGMGIVYAAYDPELDRKVALKLVRPDLFRPISRPTSRLRLLREAQAVARLSHPNVVAVHDAGAWASIEGDQVYVAMELVQGRTLRQWLQAAPRSSRSPRTWREVLAILLDAGRGLAAAHAAGLIHRDFKPDNVLIGDDGRVRVADFGLVLRADDPEAEGDPSSGAVGTPSYVAPESLRGEPVDARSDQYGFCVTLWEALYGTRPSDVPSDGMPADCRVPSRIHQALLRGLSGDPAGRFPSMEELLAVLSHDPAAVRRRWLLAAAVVLAAGVSWAAWESGLQSRARLCQSSEVRLTTVWDAERKSAGRSAFAAIGSGEVWRGVEQALDRYAAGWAAMHREACEATWLRGEQSEDLLDRRMLCLDQRLRDLDALTDLFTRADAEVVRQAASAAGALGSLDSCADRDALLRRAPPPRDPQVRARIAEVETQLSRVFAFYRSGKYGPGLAAATLAARQADALAYAPLQANARLYLGDVYEARGEFQLAEAAFYEAVWAADRGGDDVRRSWIWRKLAFTVAHRLGRPEEGLRLLRHGRAALSRHGHHARAESSLLNTEAGILVGLQRFREAIPLYRRSLTLSEREDPDDPQIYIVYANLGEVLLAVGSAEEALAYARKALALATRIYKDDLPLLAALRLNIANALLELGQPAEAESLLEEVLATREAHLGPDHIDVAETLSLLGAVRTERGEPGQALPLLRRAVTLYERNVPEDYPYLASARRNQGEALIALGRYAEARAVLRQSLAAFEKQEGPLAALPLISLGKCHLRQGDAEGAVAPLNRARDLLTRGAIYPRDRQEASQLLAEASRSGGERSPSARR
jgi:serine/threonine protein kinase/Tfp pilus assembly protein PilF